MEKGISVSLKEFFLFVPSFSLGLTFLYLYGIYFSSDFNILEFLVLNDYINISIRWLVPVVIMISFGIFLILLTKRIEKGKSEVEIAAESKNPIKTYKNRERAEKISLYGIIILGVIVLVLYMFDLYPKSLIFNVLTIASPLSWIAFASSYIRVPRLVQNWDKKLLILFFFVPAFLLGVFFMGANKGVQIVENTNVTKIIIKYGNVEESAFLLFNLDKNLIYKTNDSLKIFVKPQNKIDEIILNIE